MTVGSETKVTFSKIPHVKIGREMRETEFKFTLVLEFVFGLPVS